MFSYDEDDMVEDPNLAQHLAHFGINITQMEKVHLNVQFVRHLYLCIVHTTKKIGCFFRAKFDRKSSSFKF